MMPIPKRLPPSGTGPKHPCYEPSEYRARQGRIYPTDVPFLNRTNVPTTMLHLY